ncbi:MAG: hypothetical protein IPN76_29270 [Saprospiraceae bacterium]|nr:hypothetical protein [Saprospiraceae bacterium]
MQKRNIFIPAILFLLPLLGQAQAWKWAKSLGQSNNITTVKNIRPYTGTQVLVSGNFAASTLTLGSQTLSNAGQDDGYVAIVDDWGEYAWAAKFGGSGQDFVVDAAAASNGDFVVAGNFKSITITIGGTNLSNSGETDAFVAKYNADKTLAWAKKIGSADIDEVGNVAMDADGNTYVSGLVLDKFTNAIKHYFVRKLDAAGNQVWERKGETTGGYPQTGLALDDDQNVYLGGSVFGTATFGNTTMTSDTSYGAFIVKYNSAGSLIDTYLNTGIDKFNSITAQAGNVFACGEKINGCIGWGWPLSHSKTHVVKIDANLNTVWHKTAGGEHPCQSYDIAKSLSVDDEGNVYVTGSFFSPALEFAGDSLRNSFNLEYYYPQIFVFKYSPNGNELWGKSLGGIHLDEATCIHAFGDDKFYLGGNFESDPRRFRSLQPAQHRQFGFHLRSLAACPLWAQVNGLFGRLRQKCEQHFAGTSL